MNKVKPNNIGERLKQHRERHGLSINQFAKQAGIPASTYKEWEQGRQIRGEPYAHLAAACQISVQELLTGEKSKLFQLVKRIDEIERQMMALKQELISFE